MTRRHSAQTDRLDIGHRPGHLIWRAQQSNWRLFMNEARYLDITPVQANVLLMVGDQPGIDQKTLAAMIALDKATTGNVVRRLEARRFLIRRVSNSDRRAWAHFLTPEGKKIHRRVDAIMPRARDKFLSNLTHGERNELVRLLRKMLDIEA